MAETVLVYLVSKEPQVVSYEEKPVPTTQLPSNQIAIYLQKPSYVPNEIWVRKLSSSQNYVETIWGFTEPVISWERTDIPSVVGGKVQSNLQNSITIDLKHPDQDAYVLNQYWHETVCVAQNKLRGIHYPPIVIIQISSGISKGEIPNTGNKEDYWNKKVDEDGHRFVEKTPIIRPGESFSIFSAVHVKNKFFTSLIRSVRYETPLFTGGIIKSVLGHGKYQTYTIEIFGRTITDIVPTDLFEYSIGDWCYLLKDSMLVEDPALDNKQKFSSNDIENPSNKYRLVPFNFEGPMEFFTAINYANELKIDSASNFEEVFDMVRYNGTILSINHQKDEAEVSVQVGTVLQTHTIPIFYHCSGDQTTKGGSSAFLKNDEVIIIKPGHKSFSDGKVIGFQNKLQDCAYYVQIEVNGTNNLREGFCVRLTQPIPEQVNRKGGYTESYRVLAEIELDSGGFGVFYPYEFRYPIDPLYPLNLWMTDQKYRYYDDDEEGIIMGSLESKFRYFTEQISGDYPDIRVQKEDVTGDGWKGKILWLNEETYTPPSSYIKDTNYDFYDIVWGIQSSLNLLNYPKTPVVDENFDSFEGWYVPFEIKCVKMRTIDTITSTVPLPAVCNGVMPYILDTLYQYRPALMEGMYDFYEYSYGRVHAVGETKVIAGSPRQMGNCPNYYKAVLFDDHGHDRITKYFPSSPIFDTVILTDKFGQYPYYKGGTKTLVIKLWCEVVYEDYSGPELIQYRVGIGYDQHSLECSSEMVLYPLGNLYQKYNPRGIS